MKNSLINIFRIWLMIQTGLFAAAPSAKFKMDCGVHELYMGQSVNCHYLISSDADVLNVEVVKFPEFRGFWSENLALRQGPISLLPFTEDIFSSGLPHLNRILKQRGKLFIPSSRNEQKKESPKQALVGTYLVSAMMGKKDATILPMKIVVQKSTRSALSDPFSEIAGAKMGSNDELLYLDSEMPDIKILPLPEVPKEHEGTSFVGAVGSFNLSPYEAKVAFQPDEPTSFRISVQGRGNFPELNHLPITLPKEVELLSQHSYTQGGGDYASKAFEFSVVVHGKAPIKVELGKFLYFDPQLKKYFSLKMPTLDMTPTAALVDSGFHEPFVLPPAEKAPSYGAKSVLILFWIGNILLSLLTLGKWALEYRRKKLLILHSSPEYKTEQQWILAEEQEARGMKEAYLKTAANLTADYVRRGIDPGTSLPITQRQLLKIAKQKLPHNQYQTVEQIFESHDQIYSPTGPNPKFPVRDLLKKLLNK